MNKRIMNFALALIGLGIAAWFGTAIVGAALAGGDEDAGRTAAAQPRPAATGLDRETLAARLVKMGYRQVRPGEREHGRYEVEARDKDGHDIEIHVDAMTGKVVDHVSEDD